MNLRMRFRNIVRAAQVMAILLGGVSGCAATEGSVRSALKSPPTAPSAETVPVYTLACPDAIDITFANRPQLSGRYSIEPDGAVSVAGVGRVALAGGTTMSAETQLASAAQEPPGTVHVAVGEHRSRLLFLIGPGAESEQAVPYQGAETVVDLLRRTGGLSAQAKPDEVHVIRPHVAAGRRPEVFDVDLAAILLAGDATTNVTLQPYDQIYVGMTRRSALARYMPGGGPPFATAR